MKINNKEIEPFFDFSINSKRWCLIPSFALSFVDVFEIDIEFLCFNLNFGVYETLDEDVANRLLIFRKKKR